MVALKQFLSASWHGPATLACVGLAFSILWWLRADMKKQREWKEAKEEKIMQLERKISRKRAQQAADMKKDP